MLYIKWPVRIPERLFSKNSEYNVVLKSTGIILIQSTGARDIACTLR